MKRSIQTILIPSLLLSAELLAGGLSGKVRVIEKGSDQPEASFDNALVYLSGITTPPDPEPILQVQQDKQFQPRLVPVVAGGQVDFRNEDQVIHNVFSTDPANPFDLGRYPSGQSRTLTFDKLGVQPVYCNIHRQMVSYVAVVENRFHALTDTEGNYAINDIPPGNYQLHVWHIFGGELEQPIHIDDTDQQLELTVKSTKVVRDLESHMDKYGKEYRKIRSGRY